MSKSCSDCFEGEAIITVLISPGRPI